MWRLRFYSVAAISSGAIFFTLLAQRCSARQDELGPEILCWIILPLLFKASKRFGFNTSVSWREPETEGASSYSLWIVAACFAISCVLRAGTGLLGLFPILTPLLLAARKDLEREPPYWTYQAWFYTSTIRGTLAACFIALILFEGNILNFVLSSVAVAPLLIVYLALLPRTATRGRFLPYINDFEGDIPRLSWRIVIALILALVGKIHVYGVAWDIVTPTVGLGMLKAVSWHFIARTSRYTSWCIATAIGTFSLVAINDPSTFTVTRCLSALVASLLALGQAISILPQSAKGKFWLWVFFTIPLFSYLSHIWAVSSAQSVLQSSFSHNIHHPIELLMNNAKGSFESMLYRQSKNYTAAHTEYQRRYGIEPPKGFEAWFDFAVANQSPIIDDFDTIYNSVSPFWKLSGKEVFERIRELQSMPASELWHCHFSSNGARTQCSHPHRDSDRHIGRLFNKLLKTPGIQIPDVKFLVNHLDEPRVLVPAQWFGPRELMDLTRQSTWDTLTEHCSTLKSEPITPNFVETFGLPFVTDSSSSKDLCRHQEYRKMHGLLISPASFPLFKGLVPIISTCALSTMGDILFPSPAYIEIEFKYDEAKDIDWDKKRNEIYWAGSTTGGFADSKDWHHFHRQRFVALAQNLERGRYSYLQGSEGVVTRITSPFLNRGLFSVAFTSILQCARSACISQFAYFKPAPHADAHRPMRSRLVFDTDGNGISGRFYRLLASKSVPLKQTLLREWHDDRLVPWVHYIPVSLNMEELPELVSWLTGNGRGQKKAEEVARQGREWFGKGLREIDMSIYVYRLLLELARLQDPEREAISEFA